MKHLLTAGFGRRAGILFWQAETRGLAIARQIVELNGGRIGVETAGKTGEAGTELLAEEANG
jgi:signal transduction histidine kinase